ncbi:MAG: PLDc N-terminal domain-containing protein [Caldimicrobium sp.]
MCGIIGSPEIIVLLWLAWLILFIFALFDVLRSDFPGYDKIVWLLVVILVPLIGPIAYFTIGRKQKIKKEMKK